MHNKQKPGRGQGNKNSVCLHCAYACNSFRCGWVDTLDIRNLPKGAEYTVSRKDGGDHYKITSCPRCRRERIPIVPEATASIRLLEAMLTKMTESYEKALISDKSKDIKECEDSIRNMWIWDSLIGAGCTYSAPEAAILAIREKVHDQRTVTILSGWMENCLGKVKPNTLTKYQKGIEHYRKNGSIDVISTKRLIKRLDNRIRSAEPQNYNYVKTEICKNVLKTIEKMIEKMKEMNKNTMKKCEIEPETVQRQEPDELMIWWYNTTIYLNCMC